jgi:hypothetical protein
VAKGDLIEARLGRGGITARVEGVDSVQALKGLARDGLLPPAPFDTHPS